jgi:CDP-diacylglycerol--serine O-phosphatidyltransferase
LVILSVLFIYLIFGVIRLASFNIKKNKKYFIGMPVTAGTIILLSLAFIKIDIIYMYGAILIVSFAMISNINFPKPNFKLNGVALLLILLTIIFNESYYKIFPILLLLSIIIYTTIGPIYLKIYNKY